jgi:hypothetical protein
MRDKLAAAQGQLSQAVASRERCLQVRLSLIAV